MPEPRDAIVHADDCDRPTFEGGAGYTCDCAARQTRGLEDPSEAVETPDLDVLVGADVIRQRCVDEDGEYCGEDPCPHEETRRFCPDCDEDIDDDDCPPYAHHALDCPKLPHLTALMRLLDANERMSRVRALLDEHDSDAPPSAYDTLRSRDPECELFRCPACGRWMPWCWGHDECANCDECCDDNCEPVGVETYAEERRCA